MTYILRDDLHFCDISGHFIFLDLAYDRYFTLSGEAAACFDRFVHNEASTNDHYSLANRGILTPSHSHKMRKSAASDPALSSAFDLNLPQPSPRQTVHAVSATLAFRYRLKHRSLQRVLARHSMRRPATDNADRATCMAVAAAFNRSKRYLSAHEICLPRGLAMTHILFGLGIDARLIFGVKLPFSAHCWVQVGDTVLTDPIDRVLGFTPILVK